MHNVFKCLEYKRFVSRPSAWPVLVFADSDTFPRLLELRFADAKPNPKSDNLFFYTCSRTVLIRDSIRSLFCTWFCTVPILYVTLYRLYLVRGSIPSLSCTVLILYCPYPVLSLSYTVPILYVILYVTLYRPYSVCDSVSSLSRTWFCTVSVL